MSNKTNEQIRPSKAAAHTPISAAHPAPEGRPSEGRPPAGHPAPEGHPPAGHPAPGARPPASRPPAGHPAPGARPPAGRPKHRPGHGPGAFMPGEKARDFKGTLKQLLKFMGIYKLHLIVVFVFAIGSTVFNIIGPKVLSTATTELFTGIMAKINGTGGINFDAIAVILIATLALYTLSSVCSFVQSYLMAFVSQKTCYRLRRAIAEKINRLPFGYFDTSSTGDTLSRITNDVDTLGQSLNQGITQLITSITTLVGVTVMMLSINPLMTLVTLFIVPITAVLVKLIVGRSQKYFYMQQETLGAINGQVEETFSGYAIVRAFGKEQRTIKAFNQTNEKLYESAWKSQFLSGLMHPIMSFVGNLGYVVIAVMGSLFAVQGIITVGDIQAFIQYVKNFTQPITQLAQVANVLQQMAAAAERIFEFLAEKEEVETCELSDVKESKESSRPAQSAAGPSVSTDSPATEDRFASTRQSDAAGARAPRADELPGDIIFNHVRFGYDPAHPVIHDFSAHAKEGQTIAIVGPTGAGKTTLVKLLMRFYDVQGGSIKLGAYDLREFTRTDIRNQFGMVLQDTWLFKGSIRENIRYGRLDATDAEVEAAATSALAHHFISTLPGGYDFVLSEDATNISQGQRQLLTIARAILANKRMLILDEATSSVDTRTEARIQEAMDTLMKGRTSFVIAHRLSTIRRADLILVVNHGDVIEQGTHEELLTKEGFYAQLYLSQFESCKDPIE